MIFRFYNRWRSLTAPWLWLVVALAVSAGLAAAPPRLTQVLKSSVAEALVPGQRIALRSVAAVRRGVAGWMPKGSGGPLQQQHRLQSRIRQLESQLAWLQSQQRVPGAQSPNVGSGTPLTSGAQGATRVPTETTPLIEPHLVTARVLGQQARQFLSSRALLDVGSRAGLEEGAVVLDPPLLDVGDSAGLVPGRLVLDSSAIVGRLSEVGRHTSCLKRITDESYRDLVRIVQVRDGAAQPGARGLLVGGGDGMCRVRMIDISQPVAVGDVVVADGLKGILSAPPRYGTVSRVAQAPGSAHWDIWVQPDADVQNLDVVSVLTTDVSALRIAGAAPGFPTQGLP